MTAIKELSKMICNNVSSHAKQLKWVCKEWKEKCSAGEENYNMRAEVKFGNGKPG
jgi:hypothetical protein